MLSLTLSQELLQNRDLTKCGTTQIPTNLLYLRKIIPQKFLLVGGKRHREVAGIAQLCEARLQFNAETYPCNTRAVDNRHMGPNILLDILSELPCSLPGPPASYRGHHHF